MANILEYIPLSESIGIDTEIKFKNTVIKNAAGNEQILVEWNHPTRTFSVEKKLLASTQYTALETFYSGLKGTYYSFLYRDRTDYSAVHNGQSGNICSWGQLIEIIPETGNDITYQICKMYKFGSSIYCRPIFYPDIASVEIYDSSHILLNPQPSIDYDGIVTGLSLGTYYATFTFGVGVYLDDTMQFTLESRKGTQKVYSISKLLMQEEKRISPCLAYPDNLIYKNNLELTVDFSARRDYEQKWATKTDTTNSGFEQKISENTVPDDIQIISNKLILASDMNKLLIVYLCMRGNAGLFKIADNILPTSVVKYARFFDVLSYIFRRNEYELKPTKIKVYRTGQEDLFDAGYNGFISNLLTLMRIVKITTTGGEIFCYSSHDRTIKITDTVARFYRALTAIEPTALESKIDLSTSNQEIKSILQDDNITEIDIASGKFAKAEITVAIANWLTITNFSSATIEQIGYVGQITNSNNNYTFENLSKAALLLKQNRSKKTSPMCRYVFGDEGLGTNECKINIATYTYNGTISEVWGTGHLIINWSGSSPSANYLNWGYFIFTSGDHIGVKVPIINHYGTTEIVPMFSLPFTPEVGDEITAVAGCDKVFSTCRDRYNNAVNFGGERSGGNFMPGSDFYMNPPIG